MKIKLLAGTIHFVLHFHFCFEGINNCWVFAVLSGISGNCCNDKARRLGLIRLELQNVPFKVYLIL